MKNIKNFKFKNKNAFKKFLSAYGYDLSDVAGYSMGWKEQFKGNVLKVYIIYFYKGEYKLFRIVYFKSFDECNETRLGFINNKLLSWYDSADIRKYKTNDGLYVVEK